MKSLKALIVYMALIAVLLSFGMANAGDKVLDVSIDSTTIALDKNGNEYVRFIISEPRTLNGTAYNRSLPVMAFGDLVPKAKSYQAGDKLKAVASFSELSDGRQSYRILAFIE